MLKVYLKYKAGASRQMKSKVMVRKLERVVRDGQTQKWGSNLSSEIESESGDETGIDSDTDMTH
jgi:hypothetical protein